MSVAREFNIRRSQDGGAGGGCAAHATAEGDDDGRPTSFINVDGLFASRAISAGSVILTEEDDACAELPTSERPNCEVVEDEESGMLLLVAARNIRSGEFLSIAPDDD